MPNMSRRIVAKFDIDLLLFGLKTKCDKIQNIDWGRTGLVVRGSDSGSGDPGSILGRVGVLFP